MPEDDTWPEAWYMLGEVEAGEPQKQENRLTPDKVGDWSERHRPPLPSPPLPSPPATARVLALPLPHHHHHRR